MIQLRTPKGIRDVGPGKPTFIIAELSGNHIHDYDRALKLIDAAVEAGVDAIKLQTYTPDTLTIDCENEYFQVDVNDAWAGQTLYNLYKTAYTPWDWHPGLKEYAESKGVLLFSTPFDGSAVDFLEKIGVELYKVASFESGDLQLLKKIGQTKKPVIMSRGLSSKEDVELAVKTLKDAGAPEVVVLHCVSSYPATPDQMNLRTIPDIAERFNVVAGLSDHTLGTTVPIAAVALGASVVEKHFTLSREEGGPDAEFSLEPEELKALVSAVRDVERALGKPTYESDKTEAENKVFKRSIFVVEDIEEGEEFSESNVRVIRPGYGLAPKLLDQVLGKKAKSRIKRGTPLTGELIDGKPV